MLASEIIQKKYTRKLKVDLSYNGKVMFWKV